MNQPSLVMASANRESLMSIVLSYTWSVFVSPFKSLYSVTFIWPYRLFKYLIFRPIIYFLVLIFLEIPLIPLNIFLKVFFNLDLNGLLLNYSKINKNSHHPMKNDQFFMNMNNHYKDHKYHYQTSYLKRLRYGGSVTSNGIISKFFGINQDEKKIGLLMLFYLGYKFFIISLLFSGTCAIIGLLGVFMTRILINREVLDILIEKFFDYLQVANKQKDYESVKKQNLSNIKSEFNDNLKLHIKDEEEELIGEKYGSLEYLRNLNDISNSDTTSIELLETEQKIRNRSNKSFNSNSSTLVPDSSNDNTIIEKSRNEDFLFDSILEEDEGTESSY